MVATMTPYASAIAQTIQLSVTPVFLLVATGSLLNVLAGRLSRVADRSRVLLAPWPETEREDHERVVADLLAPDRRRRATNASNLAGVACDLVPCTLVALLFTPHFK